MGLNDRQRSIGRWRHEEERKKHSLRLRTECLHAFSERAVSRTIKNKKYTRYLEVRHLNFLIEVRYSVCSKDTLLLLRFTDFHRKIYSQLYLQSRKNYVTYKMKIVIITK
jgi:hypothetical protein